MSNPGCFPKGLRTIPPGQSYEYKKPPRRLPSGRWWMIHNGRINSLDISNDPLQISWGESSIQVVDPKFEIISSGQSFRLEFVRIVPNVVRQVFVGFLMWEWDVEPRDDKYRLAGHLYEEAEPGAIAGEPGSWYATLDRADCLDADLQ